MPHPGWRLPAAVGTGGQRNVISGCCQVIGGHVTAIDCRPHGTVCRVSRDYLGFYVCALTCDVRTLKEISEVRAVLPVNLKKTLHGANLQH
jgi:hypothetical protein